MNGPILVRVSPEILERMKAGDVEPVVILGVEEQSNGTHDMTLKTPDVVYENRKLREALGAVVAALDDAIAHNVNATEHDPAGWTQDDYDSWDTARAQGEEALDG